MRNDKNSAPPANAGKPWDEDQDAELFELLTQRKSQKQIANRMERTEGDIYARLASFYLDQKNPVVGWRK